jgi:CheY-like chemotaxis protein
VCSRFTELAGLWNLDEFAPELVFADNVELFKELFIKGQYDQVIIEQRAPGGNGTDVLKWVKEQAPNTFTTLIGFEKYIGNHKDRPFIDRYCAKPYLIQEVWKKEKDSALLPSVKSATHWTNYSHLSILVVDDNQSNLLVIKGLLKRFGIMAQSCQSGQESIRRCKENKYDLVLMDYEMPDMNGPTAARQILKESQHHIVGLSAHIGEEFIETCIAAGMTDYLSKPVKISDLDNLLNKYFSNQVSSNVNHQTI